MSNRGEASFAFTHHVRDHCLCLHVQRAARALARRFDDALRPVGLTQGQFSLLTALNRAEPPTMGEVANLLALDRTTLTANLKPLERRGLVKVIVDPDDRRSRRLILTAAGRSSLAAAAPIWKREHARLERLLNAAGADMIRAGLRQLS
jgi:DNA-binding MarR family transcriptional regulator